MPPSRAARRRRNRAPRAISRSGSSPRTSCAISSRNRNDRHVGGELAAPIALQHENAERAREVTVARGVDVLDQAIEREAAPPRDFPQRRPEFRLERQAGRVSQDPHRALLDDAAGGARHHRGSGSSAMRSRLASMLLTLQWTKLRHASAGTAMVPMVSRSTRVALLGGMAPFLDRSS